MKKTWKWVLFLLILLTACQETGEPSPVPTPPTVPMSSPAEEVTPAPTESLEPERTLPALFAENARWMVYLDDWVTTKTDGSVMDLSVYEKDGTLYQKLRSLSDYTGPHPWWHLDFEAEYGRKVDPPVLLTDLNFDGIDDIRVDYETIRHGAFAAFLWNEEEQRFIEEPTYTKISAAHPMNGLVFGHGSSGASNTYYSAYSYDPEVGYQLIRFLNIEIIYLPDNEYQPLYTEWYYENGELTDTVETEEDLSQSDFWREYVEYCDEYVWG